MVTPALDSLLGPLPPEVPLPRAPLVRVIAQIRFPLVMAVEQREFMASFQEAIRAKYPILRQDQLQGLSLGPAGLMPVAPQVVWRFADQEAHWRLSLAPQFMALETTAYTSRVDFFSRFREALAALDTHVAPKTFDRLGVRYVDRIVGEALQKINSFVRPEMRGMLNTSLGGSIAYSVSETMFALNGPQLLARWGNMPANATPDPAAVEPIGEPSWLLDLDLFLEGSAAFSVEEVHRTAVRFAEAVYTFFRYAVTNDFLRYYGGTV